MGVIIQRPEGRRKLLLQFAVFMFIISMGFLQCDSSANKTGAPRDDGSKVSKKIETGTVREIGGMEFVYINGVSFMMGSPEGRGDLGEYPRHEVKVDGFWIGKYEVTQKQYYNIMVKKTSKFKGDDRPVEMVSWTEAIEFCGDFSGKNNVKARLPYEAEWEYACRAGTDTQYFWGEDVDEDYAWCNKNSERQTRKVGETKPNEWDLYDMSGNVYEWCMDWYGKDYYERSKGVNPQGPKSGKRRIARGGSWIRSARHMRSSARAHFVPSYKTSSIGFRVVIKD